MSSRISQSQRSASLLLEELHEFAGDHGLESWGVSWAPCPSQTLWAGHTGQHQQCRCVPSFDGSRQDERTKGEPCTPHLWPCSNATAKDGTQSVWWKDSLCFRNIPEYNSLKNNDQRGDLRKPTTFQLMTVFAGSAKKEQWLLLLRDYQCWPFPSQTWKQNQLFCNWKLQSRECIKTKPQKSYFQRMHISSKLSANLEFWFTQISQKLHKFFKPLGLHHQ